MVLYRCGLPDIVFYRDVLLTNLKGINKIQAVILIGKHQVDAVYAPVAFQYINMALKSRRVLNAWYYLYFIYYVPVFRGFTRQFIFIITEGILCRGRYKTVIT